MKNKFMYLMILIGIMFLIPSVNAATVNVCSSCTYATIEAAITAATGGDTIEVATGSYAGFTIPSNKKLSIQGEGNVVITGDITVSASTFESSISGLTLTGRTVTVSSAKFYLNNNILGNVVATGTASVNAENNYWGSAEPTFSSLITTSDTAVVDFDPNYTDSQYVGSNILSIEQVATTKTIEVDDTFSEYLNIESNGVYKITYTSSDATVASVNDSGIIRGLKEGTATITATTSYGTSYEVAIEVICGTVIENPSTNVEWYIIGFGFLLITGIYFGIKNYKKLND